MRHSIHTLKNGTRTVLLPHADATSVTVLALFGVGSRYESAKLNGAAHFIEHLMFKGTKRRPSSMAITRELDAVGADYNAFTGKDYTGYYIRLQSERFPLAVEMLSDMLYRSLFRPKDVASERKVIVEEIKMYEDNPAAVAEETMEERLFPGSSLGRRITGSPASLAGIDRKALVAFRDKQYVPARTVLSIAGRFDRDAVTRALERSFGARPRRGNGASFEKAAMRSARRGAQVAVIHRKNEQANVSLGFRAFGYGDRRLPALTVLSTILGETMSSRLFMELREKHGLCYTVRTDVTPYHDTGTFSVQAGLAKGRIDEALRRITRELAKVRATEVTAEELARAKEHLRGRLLLSVENPNRLAEWCARQELLVGRIETPEERIAKYLRVTRDDVRRVARELLRGDRAVAAVVGPYAAADEARFTRYLKTL